MHVNLWLSILLSLFAWSQVNAYKTPEIKQPYINSQKKVSSSTTSPVPQDTSGCVKNLIGLLFNLPDKNDLQASLKRVEALYENAVCITKLAETNPKVVRCFAEWFSSLLKYPVDGSRKEKRKANKEIEEQITCIKEKVYSHKDFILDLKENENHSYLDEKKEEYLQVKEGRPSSDKIDKYLEEKEIRPSLDNKDEDAKQASQFMGRNLIECLAYHFNATFSFDLPKAIKEQDVLRNYGLRWNAACIGMASEQSTVLNSLLKLFKIVSQSLPLRDVYIIASEITKEYPSVPVYGPALSVIRNMSKLFVKVFKPEPQDPDVKITRTQFDDVKVIIHDPVRKGRKLRPAMMFFHGGGWVFRNADEYIPQAYYLAKELGAVVVTVDYRQSPEYTYPVPVEDCLTATKYLMKNSKRFYVDSKRIGVIGDSAGGNMAASVSLMMRDKKLPMPKVQIIIYPCIQMFDFNLPSYQKFPEMYGLYKQEMVEFYLLYSGLNASLNGSLARNEHVCPQTIKDNLLNVDLNGIPPEFRNGYERNETECDPDLENIVKEFMLNPYICPLMEPNLKNLPPALVVNNEFDVLRDEGLIYGYRLQKANVPVENIVIKNGFHGTIDLLNFAEISTKVMNDIGTYLKKKL